MVVESMQYAEIAFPVNFIINILQIKHMVKLI